MYLLIIYKFECNWNSSFDFIVKFHELFAQPSYLPNYNLPQMLILLNAGHQNILATTNTGYKIKKFETNNTDRPFSIKHTSGDDLLQAIVHTEINVNIDIIS